MVNDAICVVLEHFLLEDIAPFSSRYIEPEVDIRLLGHLEKQELEYTIIFN